MWTSTSRETIIPHKYNISIQFLYLTLYTYRKRNYDIKSAYPGNQEQIILEAPVPGRQVQYAGGNQVKIFNSHRYYIVLYGYENYNMVGFEAEYR